MLPAYVAFIILIILNETTIGGSGKGKFASCAHALNWRNILKKHIALHRFPLFLSRKFLLRAGSHKHRDICIARHSLLQKAILP